MADKIVQLKDKNSNNLYPISGSSLAESVSTGAIVDGAVTTAKIADGAVTADKIADATIRGSLNMANYGDFNGTLYYTKTQEGLVFLKGALTKKSGNVAPDNAIFSTSTPIPTSLRPQSQRVWLFVGTTTSTIKTALNASGAMLISVVNGTTNNVQINATYGLYG